MVTDFIEGFEHAGDSDDENLVFIKLRLVWAIRPIR